MKKLNLILLLFSIHLMAQQDSYLSLIDYQMPVINPAHAGAEGQLFSINSRNQWGVIDQSPKTLTLVYSVARENNVGLGISVISDEVFIERQTFVSIDFSYKLTLNDDSRIYLGLKGGVNSFRANTTDLISYSPNVDPAKKDMSRLNPNVGVGFLFKKRAFWISASVPRLFNAKRNDEIYLNARDRVHFYLAGGYEFNMNESLKLTPRFIYRTSSGIKSITEGVLWASYKMKFDFGIGVRTANIISYKAKLEINKQLSLSYGYDTYGGKNIVMNQFNAHELGLKIRLNKKEEEELEKVEIIPETKQ